MVEIIKTWPSVVPAATVAKIFSATRPPFCRYYFTLGRGKPKQEINRMWFTYRGRVLGYMEIEQIVCNDGTLPVLSRLDGSPSEWQIRKDAWVAVCAPPCHRIQERVFHEPFRGWRYFNFENYKHTTSARVRL